MITSFLIEKGIEAAFNTMQSVSKNGTVEDLQTEARKQEIQARVAQELAIAERIGNAETVEIEEFYDVGGEGNVGVSAKKGSLNVGVSGEGRKVTKRIYKFKGVINHSDNNAVDKSKNSDEEEYEVNFVLSDQK